jgi:hypothetical protein
VMRCRSQAEMDALVREAGLERQRVYVDQCYHLPLLRSYPIVVMNQNVRSNERCDSGEEFDL